MKVEFLFHNSNSKYDVRNGIEYYSHTASTPVLMAPEAELPKEPPEEAPMS